MGVVYEAEQESLGRRVALKVLAPWSVLSTEHVGRFLRESRAAAQLHHTNIVPVFGMGESDGLHYYAMQFIRGTGLDRVLDDVRRLQAETVTRGQAPLPPAEHQNDRHAVDLLTTQTAVTPPAQLPFVADTSTDRSHVGSGSGSDRWRSASRRYAKSVARIGVQAAEALDYAHRHGLLHRDIKPSNLLLDAQGKVWVTDFGLAKATADDDLTRTGDLVGTIRYMAPERFRGRCDVRSDIYALGLTLYEMLARRPAFDAADRGTLVYQVTHSEPPRLRTSDPTLPRDLETIVHKAIDRNPASRYATAEALARDLQNFLDDRPIAARPISSSERAIRWMRRNPSIAGLAGIVLGLLTAIAIGSSLVAIRLDRERSEAVSASSEARERLWEAYLAQARAYRRSDEAGRRTLSLERVSEASQLGVKNDRLWVLRDEAIACLALADIRQMSRDEFIQKDVERRLSDDADIARYAQRGKSGEIVIRSISDDRVLTVLTDAPQQIENLRLSRDGRWLAGAAREAGGLSLVVWNVETKAVALRHARVAEDAFNFSLDSRRLAAATADGAVSVFDLESGQLERRLPPRVPAQKLAFDPSGRRIALVGPSAESAVVVRSVSEATEDRTISLPSGVYCVAWHPKGQKLAAGAVDGRIFVIDLVSSAPPVEVVERHEGAVISLAFHPNGSLLASGSWDGTLRIWDVKTGEPVVRASASEARRIRFSNDGRFLGPGHNDDEMLLWEVSEGRACRTLGDLDSPIEATWGIEFRPEIDLLVETGKTGLRFNAQTSGETLGTAVLPIIITSAFLPDDSAFITGGSSGLLRWPVTITDARILEAGPPEPFGPMAGLPTGRVQLTADGTTLAVVLDWTQGRAAFVDIAQQSMRPLAERHPGIERLSFSPDGRWLATGTWHGTGVKVWDVSTGELETTLPVDGSAEVAFSPDGRWLVTGSGKEYRAWHVGTWQQGAGIERVNAGGLPGIITFSNDGKTLAIVRSRSLVQLVNPEDFEVLATLVPPELRHIADLRFSPDDSRLAVSHNTRFLTLWDLRAVRSQLAAIGLDFDRPPLPIPLKGVAPPIAVHVHQPKWLGAIEDASNHFEAGRWQEAFDSYTAALNAGHRSPAMWTKRASLLLALERNDEYRDAVRAILDHFGTDVPQTIANEIAWCAALGPDALRGDDAALAVKLARQAGATGDHSWLNTLAAVLYRAGEYEEAYDVLQKCLSFPPSSESAYDWVFLAMCCQRLDRAEEAQEWLARLSDDEKTASELKSLGAWQQLELQLLRKEATELIGQKQ